MRKRIISIVLGVLPIILMSLGAGTRARGDDAAAKKVPWKISGQLEEACSCNAACPCWFNSLPSRMNCGGVQVLFITKGHYGKVKLDGLAISHFGQSPDNQTMMDSFGKWNFSYLYIDEKATPEQRVALEAVGKIVLPFAASGKTKIQYVPITRVAEGKDNKIAVGQYSTIEGHLIEGGLGGHPKIVNPRVRTPSTTNISKARRPSWCTTMRSRIGIGRVQITCAANSRWTASSMRNSPPASRRRWQG